MTIIDHGWREIQRKLRDLDSKKIETGLQGDAGSDIVNRAFFNEFGTRHIPERSFLRKTFDTRQNEIESKAEKTVKKVINGSDVDTELGLLGLFIETETKKTIKRGDYMPLNQETVDKKGSTKPLINTAQMLNSIRYEIR